MKQITVFTTGAINAMMQMSDKSEVFMWKTGSIWKQVILRTGVFFFK